MEVRANIRSTDAGDIESKEECREQVLNHFFDGQRKDANMDGSVVFGHWS